jgi:rubrerythrin
MMNSLDRGVLMTIAQLPATQTAPPRSDRLMRALEAHAAAEAHDIATYEAIAARTNDPAVAILLGLVIEDEHHHHDLLRRLVSRLEDDVAFSAAASSDPLAVSEGAVPDPEMASTFRSLIRDEQEGARYLRHLARQEPRMHAGLFALLLESMARDSEKHAHILRFILKRLDG